MTSAADFLPQELTIEALRRAATECRGCALHRHGTQTVFGEGAASARVVLVGEQPGDKEDRSGHPFVGPAGTLLDEALAEAGIERATIYVTNAVKHFKWEPRGTRRLHKKPSEREIDACTPWLLAEVSALQPRVVVCMGATAVRAAFGRHLRLADHRGRVLPSRVAAHTLVTIHPSAVLRLRGRPQWHDDYLREHARLVAELAQLRGWL